MNRKRDQTQNEAQPKRPAKPPRSFTPKLDSSDHQAHGSSDVEVIGHRLCNEALVHFRSKDLSPNRDHDRAVKHETTLPEHQGDEQDERAKDGHLLVLITVTETSCLIVSIAGQRAHQ
jgi:hypothetical protein